jgi:hypothetical protein
VVFVKKNLSVLPKGLSVAVGDLLAVCFSGAVRPSSSSLKGAIQAAPLDKTFK